MDLARYIASRFPPWRKRNSLGEKKDVQPFNRQSFGAEGEKIAAHYLKKRGFRVLYKNFRSPSGGEIDLVCRDCRKDCLVFVEVKRRQSYRYGPPSLVVQSAKQHLLVRGACAWLRLLGKPEVSCRFDIVEIIGEKPEIRHIQDAFPLPAGIYP